MIRSLWLLVIAGLIGCGSSGPVIRHKVPMEKLWHTPPPDRVAVGNAYKRLLTARAELAHTRFLLEDTRRQAAIADAERDRARLGARIVELEKKRHAASYRGSEVAAAAKQLASFQKQERTVDRKVAWLDRREDFLRREITRLEIEVHASEAALELAKAKVAVARGAIPKKDLQPFVTQAKRADRRAAAARQSAQNAREKSEAARKAWGGDAQL